MVCRGNRTFRSGDIQGRRYAAGTGRSGAVIFREEWHAAGTGRSGAAIFREEWYAAETGRSVAAILMTWLKLYYHYP